MSQGMKQVPVVIKKVLNITPGRSVLRAVFSWMKLVEFCLFPLGFVCLSVCLFDYLVNFCLVLEMDGRGR